MSKGESRTELLSQLEKLLDMLNLPYLNPFHDVAISCALGLMMHHGDIRRCLDGCNDPKVLEDIADVVYRSTTWSLLQHLLNICHEVSLRGEIDISQIDLEMGNRWWYMEDAIG